MKSSWPKHAGIRAGLVIWRWVRPVERRRHPRGLMLANGSRETVVLVWALGLHETSPALQNFAGLLSLFDRVVLVTDDWTQGIHPPDKYDNVVLPSETTRSRRAPELDWNVWTKRRKQQIRHDWSPDFEIALGAPNAQLVPSG